MNDLIFWLIGLDSNYDIEISRSSDWGDERWYICLTIRASNRLVLSGNSFREILTEAKFILEQE